MLFLSYCIRDFVMLLSATATIPTTPPQIALKINTETEANKFVSGPCNSPISAVERIALSTIAKVPYVIPVNTSVKNGSRMLVNTTMTSQTSEISTVTRIEPNVPPTRSNTH